jgi:signal transduction histidine kinase
MASIGKLTEGLIDRILNPMNYIINFSKMSVDLLKDLKDDIGRNKEHINEDDYQDTEEVMDMLTDNLKNVDHYGQNASHMLKAMEEMLQDRTGGYADMDLRTVLQQNEQMFDSYFAKEKEQYGIQPVFTIPDDAMFIHGNPDMLSKTIMGLLSNAVYAVAKKAQRTSYHPEIALIATLADDNYILKIRDNGIGIEETIIDKVFDPFFTTKTTDEATGIGLYLSREIIQNHGGDISVVSVKDEYTEFTVMLPMLQEEREARNERRGTRNEEREARNERRGRRNEEGGTRKEERGSDG